MEPSPASGWLALHAEGDSNPYFARGHASGRQDYLGKLEARRKEKQSVTLLRQLVEVNRRG